MPELEQIDSSASLGADIFCPVCGYSLQAAPSDRCPECGHSLDNLRSRECKIPWARRPMTDRYLAYWKTVWMVTFRPIRFCEEYAHVLRLRDARLFQLVTVVHAVSISTAHGQIPPWLSFVDDPSRIVADPSIINDVGCNPNTGCLG